VTIFQFLKENITIIYGYEYNLRDYISLGLTVPMIRPPPSAQKKYGDAKKIVKDAVDSLKFSLSNISPP
jgi:hypothetical protein